MIDGGEKSLILVIIPAFECLKVNMSFGLFLASSDD